MTNKLFGALFLAVVMTAACESNTSNCGDFGRGGATMDAPTSLPGAPTQVYCGPYTNTQLYTGAVDVGGGSATGGTATGGVGGTAAAGRVEAAARRLRTPPTRRSQGTSDPTISESGKTHHDVTIYSIGPGRQIDRRGGNAATVWCYPSTGCIGRDRTESTGGLPSGWIDTSGYAYFRETGENAGLNAIFTVDSVVLSITF